ncbi:hypothetical protein D9M72_478140 [compost metagenome]
MSCRPSPFQSPMALLVPMKSWLFVPIHFFASPAATIASRSMWALKVPPALPYTRYTAPLSVLPPPSALGAPIRKSSYPSPLTSPAPRTPLPSSASTPVWLAESVKPLLPSRLFRLKSFHPPCLPKTT